MFQRAVVADRTRAVCLQVDEISMHGALVDEIDTGIGEQLLVTGNGADLLGGVASSSEEAGGLCRRER